jgi:1-deoxy-D-xylulose-5-phosphate synthase
MVLPDIFQDQDKPDTQYTEAGLRKTDIVTTALLALGEDAAAETVRRAAKA